MKIVPWKFVTPNIEVEVKYKKTRNKLLAPSPRIQMRTENGLLVKERRVVKDRRFMWKGKELASETKFVDPDTGEQVPTSEVTEILEHFGYTRFDAEGKEVDKEDIRYFVVKEDGTETAVKPFDRFDALNIPEENWVPSTTIDRFLIKSVYEIFSDKKDVIRELFEEAEKRLKNDQIGIAPWSWGKFKQCYAFAVPYLVGGQFGWLVKFTEEEPELQHQQDIPTKVKIPIREVPTLKSLPPVQALVVVAKSRK